MRSKHITGVQKVDVLGSEVSGGEVGRPGWEGARSIGRSEEGRKVIIIPGEVYGRVVHAQG
jgi:hypothetical protein